MYDAAFRNIAAISPLTVRSDVVHAYHLYVVRLTDLDRQEAFHSLREAGIGVNVHYIPVHLHPFYRRRFGTNPGLCPTAEKAYEQILSLPMYPAMTDGDVEAVMTAVMRVVHG